MVGIGFASTFTHESTGGCGIASIDVRTRLSLWIFGRAQSEFDEARDQMLDKESFPSFEETFSYISIEEDHKAVIMSLFHKKAQYLK